MKVNWSTSFVAAMLMAFGAASSSAQTSINLDFNAPAGGVGNTGFDAAFGAVDANGFRLVGGRLEIDTLPGDTFGAFENDPDSAVNHFYSNLTPLAETIVEATVSYRNLNQNFHGGGIFLGTDQDHYIRLGLIHNSFEGGIVAEALRENEAPFYDIGPGNGDIVGVNSANIAASNTPVNDVILRLHRTGNTAEAFYSTNGGGTFTQVGGTFNLIETSTVDRTSAADPGVPTGFKVGVYAFGGGNVQATAAFDSFSATSIPEPGSAALALISAVMLLRKRR